MAEAPQNIEDVAKTAATQQNAEAKDHAKEQKPKGTLESVVNETLHAAKTFVNLGLAAAIPIGAATYLPQLLNNPIIKRDTGIMAGAQLAADATNAYKKGEKFTSGKTLEAALLGTAIATPLSYLFSVADKIPLDSALGYAAKIGYWGGVAYPVFVGSYQIADYLIRNRKFSGIGKYLKENYWPTLKRSWKYLFPISILNVLFAPPWLHIPIAATLSYIFDLFGAPKKDAMKEEDKRDKTPYLVATSNVLGRLGKNTAKGIYDVAYGIGSAVRDLYKSAPSATPAATQALAPTQ